MDLAAAAKISQEFETALDSAVTDLQIEELAIKIVRWEHFATFFDLSEAEQEEIRMNNVNSYRQQKRAALYAWRQKNGRKATYRVLLSEVERVNKQRKLTALDTFRYDLIESYARASHPCLGFTTPFSHPTAYVELPLFEAPVQEESLPHAQMLGIQQHAQPHKSINLSRIFLSGSSSHETKRKVILLEGVAGCGKTTLAWHAFQEWAEGKLFEMFDLLIHVSLEDPDIQSATCLADIIPHPSSEMRETVANEIAKIRGKKVCFLLDGWDELPPSAQHSRSFLYRLIAGKPDRSVLSHCSIIVTSRPGATGSLRSLLTSRIVVGRLDRFAIDTLFNECLSFEESEGLSKVLQQRPRLANLCNLPINAMIVIHLYHEGVRKFPETRTELFKALLCYVLRRHIELRTEHDVREVDEQFDFEELPQDVLEKFTSLCLLGFRGIMEHSKVFKTAELKGLGLSFPYDTISLMETHLTTIGSVRSFAFLHFSVQEFLAAWHMSRLDRKEQAKAVSDILHSNPLSPVLPFFSGLTRLSNPTAREILLEVTKDPLDFLHVLGNMPKTESADKRRLALALVNCAYESQDPRLCKEIAPPWHSPDPLDYSKVCTISFRFLGLEPSDCLSIGHLMAYQSSCRMDVAECEIGDTGIEALLTQLKQSAQSSGVYCDMRWLDLTACRISIHCVRQISPLLTMPHLSSISFCACWNHKQAPTYLKYLIEGLSRRETYCEINLAESVSSAHILYLVLLFIACPLRFFQLKSNDMKDGMPLMAEAIKQSTSLRQAWLSACNIGDSGLLDLGCKARTTIALLVLDQNQFSSPTNSSAVKTFLRYQFFSELSRIDIGRELNEEEKAIYKELRVHRSQNNLPPLFVENLMSPHAFTQMKNWQNAFSLVGNVLKRTNK